MNKKYDLFLSHSHQDKDWVRMLAARIERESCQRGTLKVFFDEWDIPPGGNILNHLEIAINASRHLAIVLSPDSVSSEWVLLERSIAKWFDPAGTRRRVIPLLLHPCEIPKSEMFLRYIDFTDPANFERSLKQLIATLKNEPLPRGDSEDLRSGNSLNWEPLLSKIEADQFTEDAKSHQYGGWSKAYALHYLPLAFPDQLPPTVSSGDSVTVTHWVVRGLISLRNLISKDPEAGYLANRLARLLSLARFYLMGHFDGRGAGVFRSSAEGEVLKLDVRHSAAFVKAMLILEYGDIDAIRKAARFSLQHFDLIDQLLSSYAEVYHLISLKDTYPDLLDIDVSDEVISEIIKLIETQLLQNTHILKVGSTSITLLGSSKQLHMLPHYSWWILDACGSQMAKSSNSRIRTLLHDVLHGLDERWISGLPFKLKWPL
jgi:hypothetical protein